MVGFLPDTHCFQNGYKSQAVVFHTFAQNGGAWSSSSHRAPATAYATGGAAVASNGERTPDRAQLSALPETAPASSGAPISDVGDFLECQVLRLILLTDLHKAKRAHRPTARIVKRLRDVTARLAAQ